MKTPQEITADIEMFEKSLDTLRAECADALGEYKEAVDHLVDMASRESKRDVPQAEEADKDFIPFIPFTSAMSGAMEDVVKTKDKYRRHMALCEVRLAYIRAFRRVLGTGLQS